MEAALWYNRELNVIQFHRSRIIQRWGRRDTQGPDNEEFSKDAYTFQPIHYAFKFRVQRVKTPSRVVLRQPGF